MRVINYAFTYIVFTLQQREWTGCFNVFLINTVLYNNFMPSPPEKAISLALQCVWLFDIQSVKEPKPKASV